MKELSIVSNNRPNAVRDPMIDFLIPYDEGAAVSVWIRTRECTKRKSERFHARVIAGQLAGHISMKLEHTQRHWHGLALENEADLLTVEYLLNDPQGVRDAFLSVPLHACFENNWDRLYTMVRDEAARVARAYYGKVLTYHFCSGVPAC